MKGEEVFYHNPADELFGWFEDVLGLFLLVWWVYGAQKRE